MSRYRPVEGERLFASMAGNHPEVITVVEYYKDEDSVLPKEQLRYIDGKGKTKKYTFEYIHFYPEVDINVQHIYVVQAELDNYDMKSEFVEMEFFFKPEDAFQHIRDIKAGKVNLPEELRYIKGIEYSVLVEEIV